MIFFFFSFQSIFHILTVTSCIERARLWRHATVMAPAVEIDPRLLRQLEEEYESLKNDAERESKSLERRGRAMDRDGFFFFLLFSCTRCDGEGSLRQFVSPIAASSRNVTKTTMPTMPFHVAI